MTTALTPVTLIGPYPLLPVGAGSLAQVWTTGDVAGNTIAVSGSTKYVLLWRNTHATLAKTITITSVVDTFNRTGDITTYSIPAGAYGAFYFSNTQGWVDGSGNITITPATTDIGFMLMAF